MNRSTVSFAVFMRSPPWISVLAAIRIFSSIWTEARSYGLVADHLDRCRTVRPSPRRISLRRICRPWVKTASTEILIYTRLCRGKLNIRLDDCLAPSCSSTRLTTLGRVVFFIIALALRFTLPFDRHCFHTFVDVPMDRGPMNLVREELRISRGIIVVAPGKIRGESSSNGSEVAECRVQSAKIRAELSSILYPRNLRSAAFTPHFHAELPSNLSMEQAGR